MYKETYLDGFYYKYWNGEKLIKKTLKFYERFYEWDLNINEVFQSDFYT